MDEYRGESSRVEQFLRTHGGSLVEITEVARDRASTEMQFEEAERMHQRLTRIHEVQTSGGELARSIDRAERHCGATIRESRGDRRVVVSPRRRVAGAGSSVGHRSCRLRYRWIAGCANSSRRSPRNRRTAPNPEDLSILMRWHSFDLAGWRMDRVRFAGEDPVSKTGERDRPCPRQAAYTRPEISAPPLAHCANAFFVIFGARKPRLLDEFVIGLGLHRLGDPPPQRRARRFDGKRRAFRDFGRQASWFPHEDSPAT